MLYDKNIDSKGSNAFEGEVAHIPSQENTEKNSSAESERINQDQLPEEAKRVSEEIEIKIEQEKLEANPVTEAIRTTEESFQEKQDALSKKTLEHLLNHANYSNAEEVNAINDIALDITDLPEQSQ